MIECTSSDVRDALPDLLHGRLSEMRRITVEEHVATCDECREELEVLRAVRGAMPIAPAIDGVKVARAITPYPAVSLPGTSPRPTSGIAPRRWLLAASAVAVIAAGWAAMSVRDLPATSGQPVAQLSPSGEVTPAGAAAATATEAVVELAGVEAAATAVASAATIVGQVASLSFVGGTQDLSDSDIEQLVADLEGMDAMPAAEPRSVTTAVELTGEEQ